MAKIGVVSGSFDPFTLGHAWLVWKACEVFDEVIIIVGKNSSKNAMFSDDEKSQLIYDTLEEYFGLKSRYLQKIGIVFGDNHYLIDQAEHLQATHLIRGIRTIKDFEYEKDILNTNRRINESLETVFFIAPEKESAISSSKVKELIGFKDWELVVGSMVGSKVLAAIKAKFEQTKITA